MADTLAVSTRREAGIGIVEAEGYINNTGGEKVAETCNDFIGEGVYKLILNLEKCSIVNSVGISFLIEILEKIRELNGRVAFCCVRPTIGKTFRIMGLLQTATLFDTEAEAVQALSK